MENVIEKLIFNVIANYIESMEGDVLIEVYPNKYKKNPRTIKDTYYDFIAICKDNSYKIGIDKNLEIDFIQWI